ncbi:MAG: GNAT family N-acetyltransferase [Flavobacteriaceae bacterium]|nr:GNAT family N-acetyltransferase [Flavobacteriaceae bacterium]
MNTLSGADVYLRALEPGDLDFLYALENDEAIWEVSNTTTPYSKFVLKQYLENAHRDIYEVKQLRLVICTSENDRTIGFVDLFDFDPKHKRVGVGIIIHEDANRNSGFATQTLELLKIYTKEQLGVHQMFANITMDNEASLRLFEKVGFKESGVKKDWILSSGTYKDELIYQYINE